MITTGDIFLCESIEDIKRLFIEGFNDNVYYHGTDTAFDKLRLNKSHKILWLAPTKETAIDYAEFHSDNSGDDIILWEVILKSPKLLDLTDVSNPDIQELKEEVKKSRMMMVGLVDIPDDQWIKSYSDFGLIEGYSWVVNWIKSKKYDGVIVKDATHGDQLHKSVGLFKLGKIKSQRVV